MHRVYIQYSLRNWSNTWWLTLRGCSISRGLCTYMCFTTQSNFFSSLHYGHHHFLQQINFEVSTQLKALLGFSQYYSSTYMDRKPCLYYLTLPLCLQLIRSGVVPARKLINQILSPGNFSWGLLGWNFLWGLLSIFTNENIRIRCFLVRYYYLYLYTHTHGYKFFVTTYACFLGKIWTIYIENTV